MNALHKGLPQCALRLAAIALGCLPWAARAAPWQLQLSLGRGTPGGMIQVRENDVQGTPLYIGPELGIHQVQHVIIGADDELGNGRALVLHLDLARLYGETQFTAPVYFNGVQLAGGYPLTSDASRVNNWQFTGLYRQPLYASTGGIKLDAMVGFTYVGLTYSLQGHPAGSANPGELSGDRTKEDFITQELPVPQFGVRFEYPLDSRLDLEAGFTGGHLPRLYSLRNEGGKVYVTQTNQSEHLGLAYAADASLQVGFSWYDRYYMQYEQSSEDGNYIRLAEHGYYLSLRYRF
ncbi:MAG: hypothetical protein KGL13_08705 [Gammaproteobacteria bacterium]|nr:hypothetical protein [Gammaproteobacteria bacterium]